MIVTEVCPWCHREIKVSYGLQACPECSGSIRVYPDTDAALAVLAKLVLQQVGFSGLLKLLSR